MAKAKEVPNPKLAEEAAKTVPENPQPTAADKAYLRGLKRRGYSDNQIREIARKVGYMLPPDFFAVKAKAKPAPVMDAGQGARIAAGR